MIIAASQSVADKNVERDDQEGSDPDHEIENIEHANDLHRAVTRLPQPFRGCFVPLNRTSTFAQSGI
jgi:hypothetical protein